MVYIHGLTAGCERRVERAFFTPLMGLRDAPSATTILLVSLFS